MDYLKTIDRCVEVFLSFNRKLHTIDVHIINCLNVTSYDNLLPEQIFIKNIVEGLYNFRKMLKIFWRSFISRFFSKIIYQDQFIYRILFLIFSQRIVDININQYINILSLYGEEKMSPYVSYLSDVDFIKTSLTDELLVLYDREHVDDNILGNVYRYENEIKTYLEQLKNQSENLSKFIEEKKTLYREKHRTQPIEFNLTKPKSRVGGATFVIEEITPLNNLKLTKPGITNTITLQEMKEQQEERLQSTQAKLIDYYNSVPQYTLETLKTAKISRTEKEYKDELEKINNYKPLPYINPRPTYPDVKVHQNITSILRESKLIKDVEDDQLKQIQDYEMNLRDSKIFDSWQKIEKEKDQQQKEEAIKQRKISMHNSRMDAIMSHQKSIQDNQINVLKQKNQKLIELNKLQTETKIQMDKKKENARKIKLETETKTKEKMELLYLHRINIHDQVLDEKDQLFKQKNSIDDNIMRERLRIIDQIKHCDFDPKTKKPFDPKNAYDHGLLSEMSLEELKQRLSILKAEQKIERDKKRNEIMQSKLEKEQELEKKLQQIQNVRMNRLNAREMFRQQGREKRLEIEKLEKERLDRSKFEMRSKIENKIQRNFEEIQRLNFEEIEQTKQRVLHNNNYQAMETKRFLSNFKNMENKAISRQEEKQTSQMFNHKEDKIAMIDRLRNRRAQSASVQRSRDAQSQQWERDRESMENREGQRRRDVLNLVQIQLERDKTIIESNKYRNNTKMRS